MKSNLLEKDVKITAGATRKNEEATLFDISIRG